ncbi:MAG: iron ABC transporter permease [Rubrivivax sp.]|nr:MAG: iron ABC transporter permease [Rubrivivax sp.]
MSVGQESSKRRAWVMWSVMLCVSAAIGLLGLGAGSTGWDAPWAPDPQGTLARIVWEIRAPRTVGAWLVGALLGLAGAVAQGLFRNPLAEPYLLGSAAGAALCMAVVLTLGLPWLSGQGWWSQAGLTGAAFIGAVGGVLLTLVMSRGAAHTLRLLLAGVVVGVVLGALTQLLMVWSAEAWRVMQAFMLGSTALLGWQACLLMGMALAVAWPVAQALATVLDALSLGEDTARTLGIPLGLTRAILVAVLALATAAAVAQAGLIAFVGLVAPHLVRPWAGARHAHLLMAATAMGGALMMVADVLSRWLIAPQELPVGVLTAVLGGVYLLVLLHRQRA